MLIAEITILGLLSLKKSAIASALMLPLLIITILFGTYIRQEHFHTPNRLPSRECLKKDLNNQAGGEMEFSFLQKKYLQPALQSKEETFPENFSIEQQLLQEELHFLTPSGSEVDTGIEESADTDREL